MRGAMARTKADPTGATVKKKPAGVTKPHVEKPARGRDMFTGTHVAIAAALQPHLQDSTELSDVVSRMSPTILMRHREMLKSLHTLCPSMNYQKMKLRAALTVCVANLNSNVWKTPVEAHLIEKWVDDNEMLVRNMTRHVAKTITKAPKTAWLQILFATGAPPGKKPTKKALLKAAVADDSTPVSQLGYGAPSSSSKDNAPKPGDLYTFGYENETGRAWRELTTIAKRERGKHKEYFQSWVLEKDTPNDDIAVARWHDGTTAEIVEKTAGEIRGIVDVKGAGRTTIHHLSVYGLPRETPRAFCKKKYIYIL